MLGPGAGTAGVPVAQTVLVTVTVTAGAQAEKRSEAAAHQIRSRLTLMGDDSAGERSNREELEAEHVDSGKSVVFGDVVALV